MSSCGDQQKRETISKSVPELNMANPQRRWIFKINRDFSTHESKSLATIFKFPKQVLRDFVFHQVVNLLKSKGALLWSDLDQDQ